MEADLFERLKESLKEAAAISRGEKEPTRRIVYSPEEVAAIRSGRAEEIMEARRLAASRESTGPNVKSLRENLELSQSEFARLIRVNVRTLQNWEQGHRRPTGPAKVLLELVAKAPDAVLGALYSTEHGPYQ